MFVKLKRSQQTVHVLRRLRSFHLDRELLLNLYRGVIEPVLPYCNMILLPSVSVSEREKRLFKIAHTESNLSNFLFFLLLKSQIVQFSPRHFRSLLSLPIHNTMNSNYYHVLVGTEQ